MDPNATFMKWYASARKQHGLRVTNKAEELRWMWKTIHYILLIITLGKQKTFYTKYTTTLGNTIYFPAGWNSTKAQPYDCIILRHETEHVRQNKALGLGKTKAGAFLMGFLYLFVPLPIFGAWFRYKFEREAFRASYYASLELGFKPNIEHYVTQLSGPQYFWTWWSKKGIRKWFTKHCRYLT